MPRLDKFNVVDDGTLAIPSQYLEVVITKRNCFLFRKSST
jgi:hypothetical protein